MNNKTMNSVKCGSMPSFKSSCLCIYARSLFTVEIACGSLTCSIVSEQRSSLPWGSAPPWQAKISPHLSSLCAAGKAPALYEGWYSLSLCPSHVPLQTAPTSEIYQHASLYQPFTFSDIWLLHCIKPIQECGQLNKATATIMSVATYWTEQKEQTDTTRAHLLFRHNKV